ncbi:hypothetical protein [Streptomyces resistomycificus]|uniref:Uncharacterized protein n=1 Tax=Streptomyces resistomycificus TaxID=67356 RepID=A0A0L8L5A8_9ACTN|nr:hypothetical protein [Streptomyces resistomycificus]KOG33284.1 hypothetical protein ADK37_23135 [Streptomyces resistomycificus]KUN99484.1 hypothetical protein AQJ84_11085 [Streptomyces resistomycificus]
MTTSKKTTPGRQVVSLDSMAKQKRDALPEPTTFELHGVEFTLPPIRSLPFELQERVGDLNNITGVLKDVLGVDTVQQMYKAGYTFLDIELIGQEWQKRSGVEAGESEASAAS